MKDLLSEIIVYSKYAKYLPEQKRRENLDEIADRSAKMHIEKFPKLEWEIKQAFELVKQKKLMPSMRSMQYAGDPIKKNNARMYNCAALHISELKAFKELAYLLLCGCGVSYSVQKRHVNQLPSIKKINSSYEYKYKIEDSIEGWADSINTLIGYYFLNGIERKFDYSQIRPKGSKISSGGKAPGAEPLITCHNNIRKILDSKKDGEHLTPLEVHDICCHIAVAVKSGGVRRSACMAIFDKDDEEMLTCKSGDWYSKNPQRASANNSVILGYQDTTEEDYDRIMKIVKENNTGEPGIFWTYDYELMLNPCAEVSLKNKQFCNLVEVPYSELVKNNFEDADKIVIYATLIATLQASYTNFQYLSKEWQENTEADALIGVSLTGTLDSEIQELGWIERLARVVKSANRDIALLIGINPAQRTTVVKPSGTASLVFGCASGASPRYAPYYIRRIRYNKNEPIAEYLINNHKEIIEQDYDNLDNIVLSIPIKSPNSSITRNSLSASDHLNRILNLNLDWVRSGHRNGKNYNNVSCTINYKADEFDNLAIELYRHRYKYHAVSLLPADEKVYPQMPFEECTKEEYQELCQKVKGINISEIIENDDNVCFFAESACSGGQCEIS